MGTLREARAMRSVLRSGEFTAIELAALISTLGDQVTRVAVSVLIYLRTGSPLLASSSFAVSLLPGLIGGPLLSGLADRLPRRDVMSFCDLIRAALVVLMTVRGAPVALILVLLFATGLASAPFGAARSALVRTVLDEDSYVAGVSIDQLVNLSAQLVGLALAGILVASTSGRTALYVDAASFLLSALILNAKVQGRPSALPTDAPRTQLLAVMGGDAVAGWRALTGRAATRRAMGLVWIGTAALVAPEGLAAPWAAELHAGSRGVGLLLLALPIGTIPSLLMAGRRGQPDDATAVMVRLLGVGLLALLACALHPPLALAMILLAASGYGATYVVTAQVFVVQSIPDELLGRAIGLGGSLLLAAQGVGALIGGLLADYVRPSTAVAVVALAGAAGCGAVLRTTRS